MSCLILGDSIAIGIAQQLPHCMPMAKVGISSTGWAREFGVHPLDPRDTVVISLGSNDGRVYSLQALRRIRDSITARRVIWVLPACNEAARRGIEHLATYHGDQVIAFAPGRDGIHPENYSRLAGRLDV